MKRLLAMKSKVDIKDILNKSSCLYDLDSLLEKEGVNLESFIIDNGKDLAKFVYKEWTMQNTDLIKELDKQQAEELGDLPYSEVNVSYPYLKRNVIYRVHGILHGQRYLLRLSNEAGDFISNKVKTYKNLPDEDYLIEEHFSKILDLDKSKEMYIFGKELNFGFKLIMFVKSLLEEAKMKCSRNIITKNEYKTLKDIRYLPKIRQIYKLSKEIPNETVNAQLLMSDDFFHWSSKIMAEQMIKCAKENNLKMLHAVVGLGHESLICYYLKNPY